MKKPQKKKSAGTAERGNVTVDLGEKHSQRIERMIESKLSAAGMAGTRSEIGKTSLKPAAKGGKPGMFGGGYKPWYSRFGRPWLGQDASVTAYTVPGRRFNIIPVEVQTVKTADLITGMGLGLIGNRALVRLTPMLTPNNNSRLLHEGIALVAGLLPVLFKRNAMTVGVALPGAVFFAGSLVDMLYNAVGMPSPALAGSQGAPRVAADPHGASRERLQRIQQRINAPVQSQSQRPLPRVMAVPQ